MTHPQLLLLSALAMVLLTAVVAGRLLYVRTQEMKKKRVHPQAASNSLLMAAKLENVQAADNFRNLFEVPVLFYALVATALATSTSPGWLVAGAWVFVALRMAHSYIHCTYNKVMHRFVVFLLGFAVVVGLWVGLVLAQPAVAG